MWLRYLEVLKQQEILKPLKEGAAVNFRGQKAQPKLKPMHFEVKMCKRNFGSCF